MLFSFLELILQNAIHLVSNSKLTPFISCPQQTWQSHGLGLNSAHCSEFLICIMKEKISKEKKSGDQMKQSGSVSKMEMQVIWMRISPPNHPPCMQVLPSQQVPWQTKGLQSAWRRGRCWPTWRRWSRGWAGGKEWPGVGGVLDGCFRWPRAGSRCCCPRHCEGRWLGHDDPRGLDSLSQSGDGVVTSLPLRGFVALSATEYTKRAIALIIPCQNTDIECTKQIELLGRFDVQHNKTCCEHLNIWQTVGKKKASLQLRVKNNKWAFNTDKSACIWQLLCVRTNSWRHPWVLDVPSLITFQADQRKTCFFFLLYIFKHVKINK